MLSNVPHWAIGLAVALALFAAARLICGPELFRRILAGGPPPLQLTDLSGISFADTTVDRNPPRKLEDADRNFQVVGYDGHLSVLYSCSDRPGARVETIDIMYRGYVGMILTMRNGRVVLSRRIGGLERRDPELTREEWTALNGFRSRLVAAIGL